MARLGGFGLIRDLAATGVYVRLRQWAIQLAIFQLATAGVDLFAVRVQIKPDSDKCAELADAANKSQPAMVLINCIFCAS